MKKLFTLFALLSLWNLTSLTAQTRVWATSVDFNGNVDDVQTLAQINASIPESGTVLVQFDGTCISSVGDRIVLAASDDATWHVNSGAVSCEANPNQDEHSFSHSRVYSVNSGTHSFYAVAQRYVETSGDGNAEIVGILTVKFFPDGSDMTLNSTIIEQTGIDVRTDPVAVGQININPTMSGTAIVRFNGYCISSPGDRIVLAASDTPDWGINDGNTSCEAIDTDYNSNSFSHTRVYEIGPGSHTFYAVAHNYVETDGSGEASIYATLTVEFIPDMYNTNVIPAFTGINGNFNLNTNTSIASVAINAPEDGAVIATFDGLAIPDGFLLLGVSDQTELIAFGVGVSAYDDDVNSFPFSHTQAYTVNAGMHNFYATGDIWTGTTTWVYGSLTATFVANDVSVAAEEVQQLSQSMEVFPNPTADYARISMGEVSNIQRVQLLDAEGKILQTYPAETAEQNGQVEVNLQNMPAGVYYLQVITKNRISISKKIIRK